MLGPWGLRRFNTLSDLAAKDPLMHYRQRIRQIASFVLVISCVVGIVAADTDVVSSDPVDALWRILLNDTAKIEDREQEIARAIPNLRNVQDLSRALSLSGWQDGDPDDKLAQVDKNAREQVVGRLVAELRAAMGRPDQQLAAANIVSVLGPDIRETVGTPQVGRGIMRRLAPDVARLTGSSNEDIRTAAARALSNIDPPADIIAPALATLLSSNEVPVRRAGAAALRESIQQAQTLLRTAGSSRATRGVSTTARDLLQLCGAVVPRAAMGTSDPDVTVRRDCAEAMRLSAHSLYDYLFKPFTNVAMPADTPPQSDPRRPDDEVEQAAMASLARALGEQSPAIIRMLSDPDDTVRLLGRRVLEDLADGRRRLRDQGGIRPRRRERDVPPIPGGDIKRTNYEPHEMPFAQDSPQNRADQSVRKGLQDALESLAAGVNDPNVEVRRASVSVLELMGSDAAPAVPALIQAVSDRDRFVRWIAGRALGRMRPADQNVIMALAGLLRDPDLDVRQVAAVALERYGPTARAAVPALGQAVERGDPDARIAALKAIQAMGADAAPAVPSVVIALSAPNQRVRQTAARTLGRLGSAARPAESALRQSLHDTDAETRAAAAEALLSILQAEPGK